ncbi:hypothetical protein JYG23_14580 [Sedimentibacter sp. zth1]|uniref:hypothetical protein n=1 Tax=Sedimentibacter sp. zth1 TaxID=2816908 RepID=UPI001A919929|nr:hypothetical protein [Sedimentibacter sp. zth1]QSX05867.1 hypothetical protein JYG23_14580 [Sedimentibacter sp. zth1]
MNNYIYLILSRSNTAPAKLIRFCTKSEISHVSISMDMSLHSMYSFGRKKVNNFLCGGFICEDLDGDFYTKYFSSYVYVYRIPISYRTWNNLNNYLEYIYQVRNKYKYNFLGVFTTYFGIGINRKHCYFCSEFIAEILLKFKICKIKNDIHTYRPEYFKELDNKQLVYEGEICQYKNFLNDNNFLEQKEVAL